LYAHNFEDVDGDYCVLHLKEYIGSEIGYLGVMTNSEELEETDENIYRKESMNNENNNNTNKIIVCNSSLMNHS